MIRDSYLHKYRRDHSAMRAGVRGIITWMGPGTPVTL